MTTDRFHASFRLRIDRDTAWHRLTADEAGSDVPEHLWLPGFDSQVTVVDGGSRSSGDQGRRAVRGHRHRRHARGRGHRHA